MKTFLKSVAFGLLGIGAVFAVFGAAFALR